MLLREMAATMKKNFPNIPIFPAIGNHEGSPVNSFPQPYITSSKFSDQWLLDEIDILVGHAYVNLENEFSFFYLFQCRSK